MSESCVRCAVTWVTPSGANSQDSTLDGLLQDIAKLASDMGNGACHLGTSEQVLALGVPRSKQYHLDLLAEVKTAIEAVHSHVQQNYEEDD